MANKSVAFLVMDDMGDFVTDFHLSVEPLGERGWQVETVAWRSQPDWDRFDAVYICTPWDYPQFPDECPNTADALACNNFYAGAFGPDNSILPGIANGYFQSLSGTDATPAQGRYLFLVGDVVNVAAPATWALGVIALLAMGASRRKTIV